MVPLACLPGELALEHGGTVNCLFRLDPQVTSISGSVIYDHASDTAAHTVVDRPVVRTKQHLDAAECQSTDEATGSDDEGVALHNLYGSTKEEDISDASFVDSDEACSATEVCECEAKAGSGESDEHAPRVNRVLPGICHVSSNTYFIFSDNLK